MCSSAPPRLRGRPLLAARVAKHRTEDSTRAAAHRLGVQPAPRAGRQVVEEDAADAAVLRARRQVEVRVAGRLALLVQAGAVPLTPAAARAPGTPAERAALSADAAAGPASPWLSVPSRSPPGASQTHRVQLRWRRAAAHAHPARAPSDACSGVTHSAWSRPHARTRARPTHSAAHGSARCAAVRTSRERAPCPITACHGAGAHIRRQKAWKARASAACRYAGVRSQPPPTQALPATCGRGHGSCTAEPCHGPSHRHASAADPAAAAGRPWHRPQFLTNRQDRRAAQPHARSGRSRC